MSIIGGRFKIGELIGRGGMGEVYRGVDTQTGKPVAIKVLKADVIGPKEEMLARFIREGEALRKLNHPNIVTVLGAFQEDDRHYIIMELVTGGTLAELMRKQPQMPIQQVLAISLELADALTRAHHLRIIHRDIKPANILLAEDTTPRLTDFGVARIGDSNLTQAGVTVGTFAYLSPEACRGDDIDGRTDIWSFGVLLYQMLTGHCPYEGNSTASIITAILTEPVPDIEQYRTDLPVALVDLIYRMLEKNADARIPRMRMVGAELEAIIDELDTGIRAPLHTSKRDRFATQNMNYPNQSTSRPAAPNNLPAFTTPFVGREQEIEELTQVMGEPGTRLITLLGPGGIGKTRVAVATAERWLEYFMHGVFHVPLAPISDIDLIPSTIAEHIRFTFGGAADPKTQLLNYLREKEMLLVLDNFEHLTSGADLVVDILQAAPNVRILVVSRERLRLHGEHIYDLYSMILPEGNTPEALEQYPAVQLFLEGARRVAPGFALDETTALDVAHICHLVEGMPLGIELAAAWLEQLPLAEVVAEIEDSLDFLETDLRDVPERHRSVRAVFESSWNLMTNDERSVFMKLSVFRGGFSRDAAQKVAGASLRNLTALVNKSLLRRAPDGRYASHLLLRQYAEERFQSDLDEQQTVQHQHARFYIALLNNVQSDFNSKHEKKAVDEIEAEIENIRAAWHWAVENQQWTELDPVLHTLTLFYLVRSMLREGHTTFCELADSLQKIGQDDGRLYWRARSRQSLFTSRSGGYAEAFELATSCFAHFADDDLERSHALNVMSYARMMQGRYEESKQYAAQALELAQAVADKEMTLTSMGNLGYAEYLVGDYGAAIQIYEEFNQIAAAEASPISHAFGLNNLGEILSAQGQRKAARELYEQAYAIFKSYSHRRGLAFTLNNLGGVYFVLGDYAEAKRSYQEGYTLNKEIGDRAGIGHSLSALGNAALSTGDYDEARRYYNESLRLRRDIGDKRGVADSLNDLASTAASAGNIDSARSLYKESLIIRRDIGDQQGMIFSLIGLGMMTLDDDPSAARRNFEDALSMSQESGQQFTEAWALLGLGQVALRDHNIKTARAHFYRSLYLSSSQMGMAAITLGAVMGFGRLLMETGDKTHAVELISLVQAHPGDFMNIIARLSTELLDQLQADLPPTVFKTAQETGRNLDLEEVVADLLGQ